uniref:Uncharacterized protein n=1 Tax=Lepeophtheirus salmonis TaxID=72036 RepID=A0A0K2VIB6_LEPSM
MTSFRLTDEIRFVEMQGTQLCTFGWSLICLLQICFSCNCSQQGGIKSGVSLFV